LESISLPKVIRSLSPFSPGRGFPTVTSKKFGPQFALPMLLGATRYLLGSSDREDSSPSHAAVVGNWAREECQEYGLLGHLGTAGQDFGASPDAPDTHVYVGERSPFPRRLAPLRTTAVCLWGGQNTAPSPAPFCSLPTSRMVCMAEWLVRCQWQLH
jgi:hypothetical protein